MGATREGALGSAFERLRTRLGRYAAERSTGWAVGLLIVGLGGLLRYRYVFQFHSPRHHVASDAFELIALAERLGRAPESQTIADTIWPPGTAAVLAPLVALDPSLNACAWAQWLASTSIIAVVGHTGVLVAGKRAGLVAALFAAGHFGFIHYAGIFLSEQFFQLAVALALWATVLAVRATEAQDAPGERWRASRLRLLAVGAAVGLTWAGAAAFRPNAMPVACFAGLVLGIRALRRRERSSSLVLVGALTAWLLALAPLAARCSALSGGVCLVSNNVAMNIALGQAGEVKGLEFRDALRPALATTWVPPALLQHGYQELGKVGRTIYDAPGLLRWVFERWKADPAMSLVRAAGNALDLFRLEYWPDDYEGVPERIATVAKQAFLVLVVAPGLVALVRSAWRSVRRPDRASVALVLATLFGGVLFGAAGSLGEPRYRIPFDGILILLAAVTYTGSEAELEARTSRVTRPGVWLAGIGAVFAVVLVAVTAVSHPRLGALAGERLRAWHEGRAERSEQRSAEPFVRWVASGSAWDAEGNHRFACRPECSELRLTLKKTSRAPSVTMTLDDNDCYEVRFLSGGRELARTRVLPKPRGGMRSEVLSVPTAARAGFDEVAIVPLYGDGRYALGSMRLNE